MEYNPLADPCLSCGLWKGKKNPCIRPKEYRKVNVVFVGEGPGEDEDNLGEAFVGRSGRTLREILGRMGDFGEWEVLNGVRCRPTTVDGRNRAPTAREVDLCSPFLEEDVRRLSPDRIIALGLTASRALGILPLPLRELRHRRWDTPYGVAYVTWHPAAGLRPGKSFVFKELEEDLRAILLPKVPEDRTLTDDQKRGSIDLQGVRNKKKLVIDIETSSFFKDQDPFPFGEGEILLVGTETEEEENHE